MRATIAKSALLLAMTAIIAGCALGAESTPRRIEQSTGQNADARPTSNDTTSGVGRVYLQRTDSTDGASLVAVQRDVPMDASAVLSVLLDGPTTDEQQSGLRTSIPGDTNLISVRFVSSGTLQVDITTGIFDATGDDLVSALAQIVFTLSDIDGIDQVAVIVEGQSTEWPRGDGTLVSRPLTTYDFPGRVITSQPDFPTIIAPASPSD